MTPEQLKSMIDTINDGREYVLDNNGKSSVIIDNEGISFVIDLDFTFEVNDTDKARDIATALMTWVEMKEGQK